MSFFITQISIVMLSRTLFPWHISDAVPLTRHDVEGFLELKISEGKTFKSS